MLAWADPMALAGDPDRLVPVLYDRG
jgi:hypothetical protein